MSDMPAARSALGVLRLLAARSGPVPASTSLPSTRTVPSPMIASAQCASGARSPEQPRLPYSPITGVMPALSRSA